jgi:putative tryptophan/tyrosine transport system substrate-binding protein
MNRIRDRIVKMGVLFGMGVIFFCTTQENTFARDKVFTIGMMNYVSIHAPAMEGFRAGMESLGYVEGKTVDYIYHGTIDGVSEAIDAEVKRLLAQKVDLFLTAGNFLSKRVVEDLKGSGIPVVFAASSHPVENGLVSSLGLPGGDVTGVRVADTTAKTLEWLKLIRPDTKKVLLPYNPEDAVSMTILATLDEDAYKLGISLVKQEIHSVEDARAAILNLSKDVDAILRIPSPTLDGQNSELSLAAIQEKLPMVSPHPLDESVLLTYASMAYDAGKQAARIAGLIHQGVSAADIPVETAEASLTINLKTAQEIGLQIPDEVLMQAKTIIR